MQVTNLNLSSGAAPGTEICLALNDKSQCTDLSELCVGGMCNAAIFNSQESAHKCCPITRNLL